MTEIITPERQPNRRAEALGLDILPASGAEGFGAALAEAWRFNPGPSMLRQLDRARFGEPFGPEDPAGMIGFQRPEAGEDYQVLTPDQANQQYGIEGELKFDADTPEPVAEDLNRLKKEELQRRDTMRRAETGVLTAVSAGLIASIADPVNVASAFFPVVGPARYASLAARQGATRARATVGAIEGTVGAGAVEPAVYFIAQEEQADYDEVDTLVNLAFGTVLGSGLHLAGGALGDRIQARAEASRLQREVDNLPQAEREAVLRTAVAQLFEDRPVRVGPALEAARRKLSEKSMRLDEGATEKGTEGFDQTTFHLIDGNEEVLGTVLIENRGEEIRISGFIGRSGISEDDIGSLGVRKLRQALPLLKDRFPDANKVTGVRLGGTRQGGRSVDIDSIADPESVTASVDISRVQPTRFSTSEFVSQAESSRLQAEGQRTADDGSLERSGGIEGVQGSPPSPRIVVERAVMDSIGDPHPEWQAATRAHTERAEAVSGEPRNLADEETAVTENLAEWEEMLSPEERTRLSDEFGDDDKLTRNYEKAWRLGAVCRIKG